MRVLLVGNTGYITKEFVQEAFPESEVFIMGNSLLKTERKKHLIVRPFPEQDEELEDIFRTYDFELMVYFSNYITFHGTMEGEAEKLRKVLSYCKRSKEIHVIYLTGPEAGYAATTGKTLLVRGAENLCCQYGKMYQIPVKIVRIPYLYSGVYKEDYFYKMFAAIRSGEPVEIQESPDQPLQFLNSMDLAELLEKMSDNWDEEYHYLNVPNVFSNTFRELEQKIKEIDASVRIENRGLTPVEKIPPDDKVVRFKYGWFPKISLLEDFSDIYDQYLDAIGEKERRIDRWKIWLDKHRPIVKIVELVAGFFLFEFLNHLAGNQAQFKMIDLRLVFIVLFGSLYGINYGIAAAALETVSLLAAYEREGVGWTTLFTIIDKSTKRIGTVGINPSDFPFNFYLFICCPDDRYQCVHHLPLVLKADILPVIQIPGNAFHLLHRHSVCREFCNLIGNGLPPCVQLLNFAVGIGEQNRACARQRVKQLFNLAFHLRQFQPLCRQLRGDFRRIFPACQRLKIF